MVPGMRHADGRTREDRSARIFKAETLMASTAGLLARSYNLASCCGLGLEQITLPFATAPAVYLPVV
jgi:hypothetical protein